MLRSVRRKLASSISEIEEVEDFNFGSWLKSPTSQKIELGTIKFCLGEELDICFDIDMPVTSQLRFSLFSVEVTPPLEAYLFSKIRSNAVFFIMHTVSSRGIDITEIEPRPSFTAKNFSFLIPEVTQKEIRVKFNPWPPVRYKAKIDEPETFDYLSEMVPEVFNVELLNFNEFKKETHKLDISKVDLSSLGKVKVKKIPTSAVKKPKKIMKVKIPSISSVKSNLSKLSIEKLLHPEIFTTESITFQNVSYWSAQFNFPAVKYLKYYDAEDELLIEEQKKVKGYNEPKTVKEVLRLILKNVQKVNWENRKDLHIKLLPYEEEGAKFLVENDFALLQDEFGLEKKREVIAALKFLFGNRFIRTALVVSPAGGFGNFEFSQQCNTEIGWQDKLKKYCPELSVQLIAGGNDMRADLWNKSSLIYLASYETLVNDFNLKILEAKKLKQIDCIVYDEAQLLIRHKEKIEELLKAIKPRTLWAVSSFVNDSLKEELNELYAEGLTIEAFKIRKKQTVAKQAPRFIWHEEWMVPDEEQKKEFKSSLVDCQKDLRRVLETGNPFRFQANIFTLLHRLKQVSNFAPGNTSSPKTNLLLDQVLTIKENGKKVVILSQYDRLGTKKIEKLFEQNKINYLLLPGGLAADEVQKSINLFKTKANIVALITDAKISKLNFKDWNVPYVIRFDQWWNPISTWELEDVFSFDDDREGGNESTSIYNYYLLESVDQRIKELLHSKGLLNKNIYELMPQKVFDELVTIDEWLRLFNMPASEESHTSTKPADVLKFINKSTLNFFRTTLSKFFFKLGYTNVDIFDLPNSSSFNIAGEAKRNDRSFYLFARVYLEGNVSQKVVEEIVMESAESENSRVFIITKGKFQKGCEDLLNDNVTLLDGLTLSKFLVDLGLVNSQTTDPTADLKL
ncbi:MAG: restriction endonuclease [Ignavibacteria bacterium]|nr:restriction endonuclease [Ignavibacteria bacterium]MBT8390620.1 restriction endonuclease [Ignavibacteria bacterium]NNJ51805.1 hypothetical protein [Ignavibacteriaceae bacterium]